MKLMKKQNKIYQMLNKKKFFIWMIICLNFHSDIKTQVPALRSAWSQPSELSKPWTFWYWMYGAVSKEGISADLKSMKEAGIAGAYLMPIKGPSDPSLIPSPV